MTRFNPLSGLIVYDPVSDTEITNINTPDVVFPMDVEAREDGTFVIADYDSNPPSFFRFDQAGSLLDVMPVNVGCLGWFTIA